MKMKIKNLGVGQQLIFLPDDELDIFLLGRIASKVKKYEMKATRGDKVSINNFSIRTNDLIKLLEREVGND